MTTFVVHRLWNGLIVLFGVSIASFLIIHLAPGDPVTLMTADGASQEEIDRLRSQFGLDRPMLAQYLSYASRVVVGDLGRSITSRQPVAEMIAERFPVTLAVALGGLVFGLVIAIPAGVISAIRKDGLIDFTIMTLALVGFSTPVFWRGLLAILLFSVYLSWLPASGTAPIRDGLWPYLSHLILPWITVGSATAGVTARLVRSGLLEVMSEDFVRTGRAKGLEERTLIFKHALRNVAIPVVTMVGLQFGHLIAGAVVTETVFSLNGLGRLLIRAINYRDFPVVQGALLTVAAMVVLVNLVVDMTYGVLDPRVRYS